MAHSPSALVSAGRAKNSRLFAMASDTMSCLWSMAWSVFGVGFGGLLFGRSRLQDFQFSTCREGFRIEVDRF